MMVLPSSDPIFSKSNTQTELQSTEDRPQRQAAQPAAAQPAAEQSAETQAGATDCQEGAGAWRLGLRITGRKKGWDVEY